MAMLLDIVSALEKAIIYNIRFLPTE